MPLKSDAVGAEYLPREVELSPRDLLSFAAGIRLSDPRAFDDAGPEGLLGFPTYCASLEFNTFTESAARKRNPVGYTPDEGRRGVHVGQDSFFHAPLRAHERVRTDGRIVSARSTKAGALFILKAETTRVADGSPIVTSWVSHLFRGVPLDRDGEALESPVPFPSHHSDDEPKFTIPISVDRAWPHIYAECADIWNPIHSERVVALAAGLPDIIFQGTAVWSLAARELVAHTCGGDVSALTRLSGRFAGMVVPGDDLQIEISSRIGDVVAYCVRNQRGEVILREGRAALRAV